MQLRFKVAILVLQAEGLIRILVNPLILFQMTPAGIVAEPQELAVLIGHLILGCRFGRSGSRGFVGGFRSLR